MKSRNPDRYTVEHRTELEEFFETHSTENTELIEFVRKKIHTMEIDSLAMTTDGWMLGVECKYGRYGGIDVDRLHAICSRLSPRFYPLIVHTNQSKKYNILIKMYIITIYYTIINETYTKLLSNYKKLNKTNHLYH